MASFKHHCEESIRLFGKEYEEVHLWLDEFAGSKEYGMRHRKIRHHSAGIKEVIELFGDDAGIAAKQHIITDLKEEGWSENDHFPKDEADYMKMGLF
ncbi:MAG: hypothetical protein NT178_17875 [Proteobacteria bacterium]|nr:hypothetical protein [Pseudomonadota bacterium]